MSRGTRGWANYRTRGERVQGRGNRGRGSGRRGSWQRGGHQQAIANEVDADGFLIPQLAWQKQRGANRRGAHYHRNRRGRSLCTRVIDPEIVKEARRCTECRAEDAVYRCPACLKKYCSVPCFKTHKAGTNCMKVATEPQTDQNAMETENPDPEKINRRKQIITRKCLYPTKDTVKLEGLEKMSRQPNMIEMLHSASLRAKINILDSTDKPKSMLEKLMKDQEFSKFSSVVVDALSDELVLKLAVRKT